MSPQIRINGALVADVPDETGLYQTIDGNTLWIDLSGIEARNNRQSVILEGSAVGGQRVVGLTQEGKGVSSDRKRGDGKQPTIEVGLQDRPIRVSYQDRKLVDHVWDKRTYHNPRWMRR